MKTATIFKKKFVLTNKDHKKLIQRFDTSKYKYRSGDISCPLCDRFECYRCPCSEVSRTCSQIVAKIALRKNERSDYCLLGYRGKKGPSFSSEKGKKQLDRVYEFLVNKFK